MARRQGSETPPGGRPSGASCSSVSSSLALALWKLRLIVGLVFLAIVIASAMRPGIEALARRRVPRGVGVALHYLVLATLFALFIWLVVPRALGQVENALGVSGVPTSAADLSHAAKTSTGVKHELLVALQTRLAALPSASKLVQPGLQFGLKAFEVLVGMFFVFASRPTGSSSATARSTSSARSCRDRSERSCATPGR